MRFVVSKRNINIWLLCFFILLCMVFPNDIYSLKKVVFILLLFVNLSNIIVEIRKANLVSVFGLVFPIALWLYSSVLTTSIMPPFLRVFCCFMLLLIIPINYYEIDFCALVHKCSWIIVMITLTVLILDVIGIYDVNSN